MLIDESSSESSDSINTWDFKRGGVKSKRLHKVRDADRRSPARRVPMRSRSRSLSSNESPSTKTSSTSPANESDAEAKVEAVLAKSIKPAAKRRRVSRFGPEIKERHVIKYNSVQNRRGSLHKSNDVVVAAFKKLTAAHAQEGKENYVGILTDENTDEEWT
ncbi:Hypothetical predicted protein [Drosophila guanche]|uniref:Uncharacterized protein n=1 Tax=Drosophila guanche TaxID=7266 RepID=A0A3B0K0G0_DROGU|nr:Hypothetical predicted protein [Drosophila guanche]